jgi:hypothetical protein
VARSGDRPASSDPRVSRVAARGSGGLHACKTAAADEIDVRLRVAGRRSLGTLQR